MTETSSGTAGGSARREGDRRRAKDEARIRDTWGQGKLGSLAVALTPERQSTAAWRTGAVGEQRVGAALDRVACGSISVLHDRRIPGSRANIDHIAVTAAGVWVVDAKRYTGRPELRIEGGILRPRVEKLFVAQRDRTKVVDGVLNQLDVVREVVPEVPVRGALCFVDADWPLFGGAFTVRGIEVLWPNRLAERLQRESAGIVDVARAAAVLAARLSPA